MTMDQAEKEAEELLPCWTQCGLTYVNGERKAHEKGCPSKYRPAVAAKLKAKDEDAKQWQVAFQESFQSEWAERESLWKERLAKSTAANKGLRVQLTAAEQHAQAHFVAWKIEGMEEIKKAILSRPLKPHVCSSCSLFDEERTELEAQRNHSDTIAKHIDSMIAAARKPGAGQ